MKLNYKRTILVGFAFFLISAFWQAYDTIVPLILTNKFHMEQGESGFIMSLDNIFAIVMLPLFGTLSDKTRSRFGRRTPYIVCGTVAVALIFPILGIVSSLWGFVLILLLCLFGMATFRSPAVALMPDVTPKPLRSKGNAVINLLGTAGGILVLALGAIFKTDAKGKTDFTPYIIAVAALMLTALIVFLLTVKEPQWARENEALEASAPKEEEKTPEAQQPARRLSRAELRSLLFLLASVALWFIAYNAITSKYSVYATEVLEVPYTLTLMVAQGAAIASYIPVGMVASRFGRKRTILVGVLLLATAFGLAALITKDTPPFLMYILFSVAGIGWATINVNSFPMVVELASQSNVGRYTGFYYTASMAAQVVTPIASGFIVQYLGWEAFFPYSTVFAALAFLTMCFVRHGDSKPKAAGSVLESFDVDD